MPDTEPKRDDGAPPPPPEIPPQNVYPSGATLRCACGEFVGFGRNFGGHRRSSLNPLCRAGAADVLDPADVTEAAAAAKRLKAERKAREDHPTVREPTTASNGSSNGAHGRGVRVTTPRAARGDDAPTHTVHSYDVRLPSTTYTYYEFAVSDPNLAFEGSFDQFVAQCVPALFKLMGYELAMIRTVPALAEVVEGDSSETAA